MASKMLDMVKDKKVTFSYYRDGSLHYETECGFVFAVPLSDAGSATFNREEKATLFMRWIRKQLESNEKARVEQENGQD